MTDRKGAGKVRRMTSQRKAMLASIETAGRPLSVEEIHGLASVAQPGLGLRTVYRNLREMVEDGYLIGVDYPGQPTRYERVTGENRPHFICRLCGRMFILDIDPPVVETPAGTPFRVEWTETIHYGRCERADCAQVRRERATDRT